MINLLEETLDMLKRCKKLPSDVLWCGNENIWFSWAIFVEKANHEYDDSFGANEVDLELKIVGTNFWLERHEYDGSEWWEYKEQPIRPEIQSSNYKIFC